MLGGRGIEHTSSGGFAGVDVADDDHVDMWLFFTVIPSLCQLLTNLTSKTMI